MRPPLWAALRGVGDHSAWQYAVECFDVGDGAPLRELAAWYLADPASAATEFGPAPAEAVAALAGKRKSDGRKKNARKGTPGDRQMAREFATHLLERRDAALSIVNAEADAAQAALADKNRARLRGSPMPDAAYAAALHHADRDARRGEIETAYKAAIACVAAAADIKPETLARMLAT